MFVKIIENYRDSKMNLVLVPKTVILEVTEERANELIKAGVAEEFIFAVPVQVMSSSKVSNEKVLNEEEKIEITTTSNKVPVEIKLDVNGEVIKKVIDEKSAKNKNNK